MTPPIVVPPAVANTVRTALGERDRRQGLRGMTRTAALVAAELAASPITTPDVVRTVAAWHHANPSETTADGRATVLAGMWGGRAGRDWALAMLGPKRAAADTPNIGVMVALYPDLETAQALAIAGAEPVDELHLTLAYYGDSTNMGAGERELLDEAVMLQAKEWAPLEGEIAGVARFNGGGNPGGDGESQAFVALADLPGLPAFRQSIVRNTEQGGIVARRDHGFIPHITLAYLDPLAPDPLTILDPIPLRFGSVWLVWGEDRIEYPLTGQTNGADPQTAAISDPLPILGREESKHRPPKKDRLRTTSRRLNKIDENLRRKLHAGAEVAMRSGLQRAGVKVAQRASKRSKALQAQVAACDQSYPPAVLAAVGITEQEALAHAFDAYAEQADSWFDEANRARLNVLATELDLDDTEQERAAKRWDTAKRVAVGALVGWLTGLAFDRLTGNHPFEEPDGEAPVSPLVPLSLISDAVAAADGRPTSIDTDGSTLVVERFGRGITFDVVSEQGIRLGIVTDQPVAEWITWHHGDPETPFDPHLKRDRQVSRADKIAETWAKSPEVFPYGTTYWFPHDHRACTCSWASEFVAEGEPAPVAAALEAQG